MVFKRTAKEVTLYFRYKKDFHIVLLAAINVNYKFVVIDVGAHGKNSHGGVLRHSPYGKRFFFYRVQQ